MAAREGAIVSAIDFSPVMVANLRRRADEAGLAIADVHVGDGQALPYSGDTFEGAFSLFGLIFFPNRAAGFRELWRVLRPGRRAVVSSFASLTGPSVLVIEGMRSMLPDLFSDQDEAPLSDPEEFRREMSAAGFREIMVHTITHSETTPSRSEYWGKLQRSRVSIALLRRKLGEERWEEVTESVLDRLHEALGDGPVEEVFTAHLGVGVK